MDSMPTIDQFKSDIDEIYPDGDLNAAYKRLLYYIENISLSNGDPVTYDLILDKFERHIKQWKYRYGKKEADGFLSAEAEKKRKNIYDFIGDTMYEHEFPIQRGSIERDVYLFGNIAVSELKRQLGIYLQKFKKPIKIK